MMQTGRSRRRVEDARFLTGAGRFVADAAVPRVLHGHVLRAPHAHARILGIDTAAARAMPGVHLVLTGTDLIAEGLGTMPCPFPAAVVDNTLIVPPRHALAVDAVRHVGECVALVVAETPAAARDAAEAVAVAYDPLPAITDARAALAPGAPQLWPDIPGNRCFRFEKGDRAAMEAAFAAAAHVVSLDLVNQRIHALPIEPRGAIAAWDGAGFDLHCAAASVHAIRDQLARDIFRLPRDRVRVHCDDVGGGFGLKNFVYPEYIAMMSAARRLGRPVRWIGEATEELLSAAHARDLAGLARLALDADGRFLALHVDMAADMGAYLSANGPGCPTTAFSTAVGGVYAIPVIRLEVTGAVTTTAPTDAYRGAGKPEANYLTERLIEAAARQTGIDAVELRRRNVMRQFPTVSALGMEIDTGRQAENIEAAERLADRPGFAARRAASEARGMRRGLGITGFMETSRGAPGEWSALRVHADGAVDILIGTQSNGQGHETSFPQVMADRLGLPVERFRLVQADTAVIPRGNGHGGARSLHVGGTAMVMAGEALLAKARLLAAHLLQAAPEAFTYLEGRFALPDGRGMDLAALAAAAADPANLPDAMPPGLAAEAWNGSEARTFPMGVHIAEVEVDPETGAVALLRYLAVDDYGRLVNPMLTAGQVQGGVAQGIGQALLERIAYDEGGQLLSASLMDYCLPRAEDLPDIDVTLEQCPSTHNPIGVKGVGQAGAMAAPQAVMAAVLDALAPLGVTALDMPATPLRVWRAIRAASG
ncbi:MAG: xanthine dehydrogenase family protein molybdopterin-binding subunit [Acetobacteraceae bacterium]|nr:xanthine dehydrogenase family protein molybdopterin-binding subunit [Acetobacteraceae bacterium]